jgi:hypothetical protein
MPYKYIFLSSVHRGSWKHCVTLIDMSTSSTRFWSLNTLLKAPRSGAEACTLNLESYARGKKAFKDTKPKLKKLFYGVRKFAI